MTGWSCSIQLLCVPLPALLPARIIPAEHMATDVICLHESRLLRMVEVCRTGCLDAGAAGPLHPPSNPRDPAAFPGAFCIPSPNWEPHSPRLIASSCSFFFWGGGVAKWDYHVPRTVWGARVGNLPAAEVQGKARPEPGCRAPGSAVRVSRLRLVM